VVLQGGNTRFGDIVASTVDWWAQAGVDEAIDERPRDWLTPPARAVAALKTQTLPGDLAALHALLASGDIAPKAAPPSRRVAPSGDPAAALMVIADMPDPGDEGRTLFAGETARLFDAMMAAIGLDRTSLYLAPLSPWRMPGGRIDPRAGEPLAALMRHHIALAGPRALLILGDEAARALIGETGATNPSLRAINHAGGTVPAIVTFHPRTLRRAPAAKPIAWAALRLLTGVLRA
jgi:DNA polymerase